MKRSSARSGTILASEVLHESIKARFCQFPVAIEQLVLSFIGVELFRDALLTSCRFLGINEGNAVIAIYGLDYSGRPNLAFDRLRYVGSFRFCEAAYQRMQSTGPACRLSED